MPYKTLLAGLGRIGATYDIEGKKDHAPRSHLGVIQADSAFQITKLVDCDDAAFNVVQKYWKLDPDIFTKDLNDISTYFDICIFATPPHHRVAELGFALTHEAKVVVFEKPLCRSYDEARKMLDIWQSSQIKPHILVNYTRRFDERYQKLKRSLPKNPDRIVCYYSKGLENYASHHIDLVQHWFGDIVSLQAFGDLTAKNPSFSCKINNNLQADFLGVAERDYDVFDMELWFKEMRIDVVNGGTEIRQYLPHNNLYYNNYSHLAEEKGAFSNDLVSGMAGLYKKALKLLSNEDNAGFYNDLNSAINVMKVLEAVKRSTQSDGIKINLEDI